jgi:hypothetical protein
MSAPTFQTVRLLPGKHHSPDSGACVMELASMIAGEPFTDRPATACRVISALLRGYNDSVGGDQRQQLRRFASDVVGTRSSESLEHARLHRAFAAFDALEAGQRHKLRRWLAPMASWEVHRLRGNAHLAQNLDATGRAMAAYFHRAGPSGDARFVALIDELIAMGKPAQATTTTSSRRGPWTPSTRSSSMSDVADGPETSVSGTSGESAATASGTPATT